MSIRSGLWLLAATALVAPVAAPLGIGVARAQSPRTLQQALALAYANNPSLQAARASLRATDESVPAAIAGWRPTIVVTGAAGPIGGHTVAPDGFGQQVSSKAYRLEGLASVTVTQPIYTGGKTSATVHKAVNTVMSTRAQLIASEQQVFSNVVTDYVNVIANTQVLQLDINNEQVLTRQLQATSDRFRVGEITRTDVAQAEAALSAATATRQTAEGNLQTARSQFQRDVGELPERLLEPQPLRLPVRTEREATALAASNNPTVVQDLFAFAAAKDNFDVQYSALMPNLNVQATAFDFVNQQNPHTTATGGEIIANLSIPIYQGGAEYAAIRQARQQALQARDTLSDARRTAVQQATQAWETYQAAKATIESNRAAIRSNQIALEGVQREAVVGSRTTLDVLDAEQTLLNSRVALVQTLANFVVASYGVAEAVGRLTARDLNLGVPLYDDTAYYQAVKDRWIGTGDFATNQPGR
jgi:outer membrane protein